MSVLVRPQSNFIFAGAAPVRRVQRADGWVAPFRSALPLRPYQVSKGTRYLHRVNGRGALLWKMRLGKTLTAIRFLMQKKDAQRILVCAPYSALAGWWEDLISNSQPVIPLYRIKPKDRNERLVSGASVEKGWFLINKEAHLYLDIFSFHWDAVVIDETWLANPKAKVTKYFIKNCQAKYRILLTGTPAPESELQYFCQLHFINPDILGCKSFWDFRVRYFRPEGMDWKISVKGRRFLAAKLAMHCSVLDRNDVNLEHEKIFKRRVFPLSPATVKKYHEAESGLYEGKVLKFAGQWWNQMRRLCSGEEKEAELFTLLNGELKGHKIIIWCNYVEEVDRIAAKLGCQAIHGKVRPYFRDMAKKAFLEKGQYLVAQPECWKFGTNLSGVDTVIFFSVPVGLMCWQQVQERTVDLMSNNSTLIITLVAENTVEGDILDSLYEKETGQKQLDRLRRGIEARLSTGV